MKNAHHPTTVFFRALRGAENLAPSLIHASPTVYFLFGFLARAVLAFGVLADFDDAFAALLAFLFAFFANGAFASRAAS